MPSTPLGGGGEADVVRLVLFNRKEHESSELCNRKLWTLKGLKKRWGDKGRLDHV